MLRLLIITTTLLLFFASANARGVYQTPEDFISQSFANKPPESKVLWLNKELKNKIQEILQHKYRGLRVRYWQKGTRNVWILDEIGKEKPITCGIIINNNKIEQIKVLEFRESRGWEVRQPFFTKQFVGAYLIDNNNLNQHIDGITGATLSVRALSKLARIALLLNKEITL